jgi:hypothetical protein
MLFCDAWFDTFTSIGGKGLTQAILGAVVAEAPLAVLCFWVAYKRSYGNRPEGRLP